jgi:hypothetical protein
MGTQIPPQPPYEAAALAIIRNALTDSVFQSTVVPHLIPNLTAEGQRYLEAAGITLPEQQRELSQIVNLLATGCQQQNAAMQRVQESTLRQQEEFMKDQKNRLDETMSVMSAMKDGLKVTVQQIDSAFTKTMWMYTISFYLGVALIVAAIAAAFYGVKLLPIVMGSLGTANTLVFFLTNPPERLQSSRASMAQMQCALIAWFNDFYNQNALLALAATQGQAMDMALVRSVLDKIMDHTDDVMRMLQKYCKLVEKSTEKASPQPDAATSKPETPA